MSREGALWIGGLEPYMDEEFLLKAFRIMGDQSAHSVRVIRNRATGEPANYGFVHFETDQDALLAMHRLSGKVIPNTTPPARFKLNHSSTRLMAGEKDYSIWVGDLTPEVDDLELYKFFSSRFRSVRSAKVVLDPSGTSKGFGFVRFTDEQEKENALLTMMFSTGLGTRQIKVSVAMPKAKTGNSLTPGQGPTALQQPAAADASSADYSQYYAQYWSQYAAWNSYSQYYDPSQAYYGQGAAQPPMPQDPPPSHDQEQQGLAENGAAENGLRKSIFDGDDTELVDHSPSLDYDRVNHLHLKRKEELWNSIEESRW